jgi:hypothetical protein
MNAATTPGPAGSKPWYRERWVWFLIALPASAVIASLFTVVLAVRSADGLVTGDYYRRGLAINEQLQRSEQAARLRLVADLELSGQDRGDQVVARLSAASTLPEEAVLTVRLVHPGRSGADRTAVLARRPAAFGVQGHEFVGQWGEAAAVGERVAWRIVVEGRTWRLDGDADARAWPLAVRLAAGAANDR